MFDWLLLSECSPHHRRRHRSLQLSDCHTSSLHLVEPPALGHNFELRVECTDAFLHNNKYIVAMYIHVVCARTYCTFTVEVVI